MKLGWYGLFFFLAIGLVACDFGKENSREVIQETPSSLSELNERILESPNDGDLYMLRSKLHKQNGALNDAFNDVNRAISIDSLNDEYYFELGALHYMVGQVGQAKFTLEHAMELNPENTDAKLEMAEVYFVLTNHDRAMTLINDALRIDDQLEKAYFLKGLIYKEQGNATLSKSSFQTVTELNPDHIEAFNMLGMLYGAESDSLALDYYNTAVRIDSTNREVLYNRAYYLQDNLKVEEALRAYDALLRHHPGTAVAYFNKGYIFLGLLSDPASAIDSFTEAIRFNPTYFQAYTNRAVCLEELGKTEQAKEDFLRALEIEPNFEPAIAGLNRLD